MPGSDFTTNPPRIYREQDANLLRLQNQRVAVIGYGNFGRPVALNLRDSGIDVIIGNVQDRFAENAQQDRFAVYSIPEAVSAATIIFMTLPDEVMSRVYLEHIAPYLKAGDLMLFASGYNIAYEYIEPPNFVDTGLLAPRTLANNIRQAYLSSRGYPTYIALYRRHKPQAMDRLLAVALVIGALKQGALEITFQQEVYLDLFWQQALLPAFHGLLLTAAQLLMSEGFPAETVLMELYLSGELGEFFSQASQQGLVATLEGMSVTAQYGMLSRTERFQETKIRFHMEAILDAIRSGKFAKEWADEYADGYPRLARIRDKLKGSALWELEQLALQLLQER